MRHVSLYRKWRPRTFDAIVGQEPVVRTLRRAIETGRVAHAYLFSGPRGTGKTSTAKVLAMGLNCEKGPTPKPDGTCESCRAIVNNSSMDVLEMDAASNRGIDEIRDLRDRVNLAPVGGRMKVYIIDEVHMLTTEAFNALLKMLEEPPEHVVFVLATTEKHKVLPTIISRCQSFDFSRPGVALLSEKLREIADAEGIETEAAALTLASREARGSFRDAEGLLDQLSSFADGPVTAAKVQELLGGSGPEVLLETADALYERRAADALRVVDRLQNEGRDLSRFTGELVAHARRLMLLPHAPEVALAEVGQEERAGLEEQASRIPTGEVVRMIEALGDTILRAKRGGDAKLELELTFLKLARDYKEPQVDVLLRRLETLEKAVETGALAAPPTDAGSSGQVVGDTPIVPVVSGGEEPAVEGEEDETEKETSAGLADKDGQDGVAGLEAVAAQWGQVIQDLKERKQALTATVFAEGRPSSLHDGLLVITFPEESDFYAKEAGKSRHSEALGKVLEGRLGTRLRLEFRVAGNTVDASGPSYSEGSAAAEPEVPSSQEREETDSAPAYIKPPPKPELEAQSRGITGAGGSEGGDVIRDSGEVFVLAREYFDPGE
ncbi:MAG TPA: DNA polymerase III subunit gamma/tau [Rubrobacteraceae bacterium]|nr:DNA polymerase III subunit gamma/tau [Rubrobacteraceae bacterium]